MREKREMQLYTLLNKLQYHIVKTYEFGSIIGYSTVSSLWRFESKTGSAEQRRFEEVKAVHDDIEQLILRNSENSSYYNVLCELKVEVDPILHLITNGHRADIQEKENGSTLIKHILDSFNRINRNYEDVICRRGQALYAEISDRGLIIGKRNVLVNDYEAIQKSFVR